MFGRKDSNNSQNPQIPYEVYETIQESSYRRRRWIIRLIAALLLVTILFFAGLGIEKLLNNNSTDDNKSQEQTQNRFGEGEGSNNKDVLPSETINQTPQQNTSAAGAGSDPATTPQSGSDNNSTVRKPQ
jgi:hypothetical protein